MQVIVKDNVALYIDGTLTPTGTWSQTGKFDPTTRTDNAQVVECPRLPPRFGGGKYFLENGEWSLTPSGVETLTPQFEQDVREERDARLRNCDPQALPDYPHPDDASRQAWLNYRQTLRDLTEKPGFPWLGPDDENVPWPVAPNAAEVENA